MEKFKAFTLSEVLVTLSILGVVAAISIPNMVQQYQKRLTIAKLQTAYSNLETLAQNIAVNSGCYGQTMKCTGLLDMPDFIKKGDPRELYNNFVKLSGLQAELDININRKIAQIYCSKNCIGNSGAIYNIIKAKNGIYYSLRNSGSPAHSSIKDGKALTVYVITDTKSNANLKMGKNVFRFIMYDNFMVEPEVNVSEWGSINAPMSVVPYEIINKACNTTTQYGSVSSGTGCAAKIVKDGWKITY